MQSEHERFFMNTGLLYVRALSRQLCQQISSESTNPELKTKRLGSQTKRNVLLAPTMIESKASAFQSKLRHSSVGHGLQKEWFSRGEE